MLPPYLSLFVILPPSLSSLGKTDDELSDPSSGWRKARETLTAIISSLGFTLGSTNILRPAPIIALALESDLCGGRSSKFHGCMSGLFPVPPRHVLVISLSRRSYSYPA
jgi:hypothetical protein